MRFLSFRATLPLNANLLSRETTYSAQSLPFSLFPTSQQYCPKLSRIITRMSSDTDTNPHFKFYHYDPSFAGACVMAVLFGVLTVWHLILIAKHRTWYFIPLAVGGICMRFFCF